MTDQHVLLSLWTLWIVLALVSIGDLLGVILALIFGLLGAGLILSGVANWRGYVIAGLIVHVLVAGYALAVFRYWLHPASGRLGLRTLWNWPQSPLLQTIFGSVSLVGLASVLYLRPTVPWKYSVDIPLMLLVVAAVVGAEYALLPVSWRARYPVTPEPQDQESGSQGQESEPQDPEPERSPAGVAAGAGIASTNGDTMVGKVVQPVQPPDAEADNRERINGIEFRLGHVESYIFLHQQAEHTRVSAPNALEGEPHDPTTWFHASDPVRSWAESDELPVGATRVELFSIARLTARLEGSNGVADRVVGINGMAGRVVGITLERRTMPISSEPDETVSQVITKATEALSREIETCAAAPGQARAISPPNWQVVSARWVQAGSAGVSTAAKTVTDLGDNLDNVLHGEPVRRTFSWNAPGSAAAVIGKHPETRDILHVGGIVVGSVSDQPVAISACFRALASDDFTRSLAAGIAREVGTIGLSRAPTPSSAHRQAG